MSIKFSCLAIIKAGAVIPSAVKGVLIIIPAIVSKAIMKATPSTGQPTEAKKNDISVNIIPGSPGRRGTRKIIEIESEISSKNEISIPYIFAADNVETNIYIGLAILLITMPSGIAKE